MTDTRFSIRQDVKRGKWIVDDEDLCAFVGSSLDDCKQWIAGYLSEANKQYKDAVLAVNRARADRLDAIELQREARAFRDHLITLED